MALVQIGRPSMDRGSHLWRTIVRAACGIAVIVAAATAHAQQPIPQGAPPPSAAPPGTLPPGFPDNPPAGMGIDPAPQFVMPSPDAFHAVFRLHQTIADSVGDNGELTTLGGFFPHALDDGLWYFDGQFDILEDPSLASEQTLNFAANLGFGRRWLDAYEGQTFGLSAWYDVLNIGQQYDHQVSVGAELLGDVWDWRTNGYFPIGTARNTNGAPPGADIAALTGVDMEFGRRLPGWLGENGVSLYGGWYYYRADRLLTAFGGEMRLEAIVSDVLKLDARMTSDPLFKTNVSFGITYLLPAAGRCKNCAASSPEYYRLTEPAERNRTVVRALQTTF